MLCGHSYGGMVISGVAEQMAPAIRSIVFLDAFVPHNGEATQDLTSAAVREIARAAMQRGDLGNPAAARRSLRRQRCRPRLGRSPLRRRSRSAPSREKIALTGARDRVSRKSYIRAASYANPGFDRALAAARSDPSWRTYEVSCGHDVMVDMPERLTEILLEAAQ